jgi:hypothetical protein
MKKKAARNRLECLPARRFLRKQESYDDGAILEIPAFAGMTAVGG